MNSSERPSPATSSPTFEIVCGKTASPLRPILRDRFLIGAGPRCDLRLGGDEMPVLHSIVHLDGSTICIDPVAAAPPLLVNGQSGMTELQSGDEIAIGGFRMILHAADIAAEAMPNAAPGVQEPVDLAELSAAELVDLIEQEEALVDEYEAGRRAGAEALLDAVERRADALSADSSSDDSHQPEELLGGIRSAVISIGQSARQLEQPGNLTEDDVRQAGASLLDCQQQIITVLDRVLEKIERQNDRHATPIPQRDVA